MGVQATHSLYFDSGGNTYFVEAAADQLELYVGGNLKMRAYGGTALEFNVPTGNSIRFQINGSTLCSLSPTWSGFLGKFVTDQTTLMWSAVALTNGAGASAGTLTNAPAAGNPTKWIPINDNGTVRYVPAW